MALSDEYERNKDYVEMPKSLWAVIHSEVVLRLPSRHHYADKPISFDGSTAMDEDTDLQVTVESKNYKCPITMHLLFRYRKLTIRKRFMYMAEIYTSTPCNYSCSPVIKQ